MYLRVCHQLYRILLFLTVLTPIGGRKRVRVDDEHTEFSHSKRVQSETSRKGRPARVKLPKPPKVNAAAKAALKEKEKEGKFKDNSILILLIILQVSSSNTT